MWAVPFDSDTRASVPGRRGNSRGVDAQPFRILAVTSYVGLCLLALADSASAQQTSSSKRQKGKNAVTLTELEVKGRPEEEKVRAAIEGNLKKLQSCYQRELKSSPKLRGHMSFRVLVDERGKAVAATIEGTSLHHEKLVSCARNSAMDLRLKVPLKSGYTTLRYELRFEGEEESPTSDCERLVRCCGEADIQKIPGVQSVCQIDWRRFSVESDVGGRACRMTLEGIRDALHSLSKAIPTECQ